MTNRRFRPVAWVFVAVLPLAGLQQAAARDCNLNGVPDHCDANCDLPGCLQYPCGRSDDTNPQNGIPDECEGAPAVGTFTSTADFTTLGTLINLDESVPGQLSRSQLPRPMPNLWVAASHRGTIVRIDTDSGTILGEYFTAPEGRDANPRRTAVNLDGEVWVANNADGSEFGFGSITRIGVLDGGTLIPPTACEADNRATFAPPFAYNTCVDRNGDGMITTSNGLIPLPWAYEDTTPPQFGSVDTAEDECIISFVPVTGRNPGHIAVNKDNDVWVGGNYRNNTFDLVDGDTGAILETFDVGVGGHGGIIDCDDVLWSVSTTGLPGVFRYNTNFDIDDTACCVPDILVDSNNDGVINEDDNAVEETSALVFPVNSDDDNSNGISDFDDLGPVDFEDDLEEIQLFVSCYITDPTAWWSLSWIDPNPDGNPLTDTIRVWRQPDKSDGNETNPGPGEQIENGVQYFEWPPPASVWLESLHTYDDLQVTFTISGGAPRGSFDESDSFWSHVLCTPAPRAYFVGEDAKFEDDEWLHGQGITWVEAEITTRPTQPLCGAATGATSDALSVVWILAKNKDAVWQGVVRPAWLEFGYGCERRHGEEFCSAFVEHKYLPKCRPEDDPVQLPPGTDCGESDLLELGLVPSGTNRYEMVNVTAVTDVWQFSLYRTSGIGSLEYFLSITHPIWADPANLPDEASFSSELLNLEDRLAGSFVSPCVFSEMKIGTDYASPTSTQFTADHLFYEPESPGSAEWGSEWVSNTSFKIWDQNP